MTARGCRNVSRASRAPAAELRLKRGSPGPRRGSPPAGLPSPPPPRTALRPLRPPPGEAKGGGDGGELRGGADRHQEQRDLCPRREDGAGPHPRGRPRPSARHTDAPPHAFLQCALSPGPKLGRARDCRPSQGPPPAPGCQRKTRSAARPAVGGLGTGMSSEGPGSPRAWHLRRRRTQLLTEHAVPAPAGPSGGEEAGPQAHRPRPCQPRGTDLEDPEDPEDLEGGALEEDLVGGETPATAAPPSHLVKPAGPWQPGSPTPHSRRPQAASPDPGVESKLVVGGHGEAARPPSPPPLWPCGGHRRRLSPRWTSPRHQPRFRAEPGAVPSLGMQRTGPKAPAEGPGAWAAGLTRVCPQHTEPPGGRIPPPASTHSAPLARCPWQVTSPWLEGGGQAGVLQKGSRDRRRCLPSSLGQGHASPAVPGRGEACCWARAEALAWGLGHPGNTGEPGLTGRSARETAQGELAKAGPRAARPPEGPGVRAGGAEPPVPGVSPKRTFWKTHPSAGDTSAALCGGVPPAAHASDLRAVSSRAAGPVLGPRLRLPAPTLSGAVERTGTRPPLTPGCPLAQLWAPLVPLAPVGVSGPPPCLGPVLGGLGLSEPCGPLPTGLPLIPAPPGRRPRPSRLQPRDAHEASVLDKQLTALVRRGGASHNGSPLQSAGPSQEETVLHPQGTGIRHKTHLSQDTSLPKTTAPAQRPLRAQ
ncbi:basic proline-rich protein-like [Hippopotamus amphibius kiboko]|uniref:basic proline-rich protein-like n=1 Tax=Hippopotamus amphibius kiboko TaxID=575201 RepID=UPI0025948DFD|nr:basic proline-rich protein-like [Hippopotamus amphibius kiboko]